jgi:alpha-L-rhamnosidase
MKNSLSISNLKCEYSERPIGIDVINPRLSWILESDLRGQMQSAYQILVSTTKEKLLSGIVDMWDSGVVHSSETFHISYQGHDLISSQRVWWKVRVWDQEGNPGDYSHPTYWETGLLTRKDWSAKWIGARLRGGPRTTIPVPFFRRPFNVGKKVARARLYITSLGLYEVQINGKKVGDDILTPGWTDYISDL